MQRRPPTILVPVLLLALSVPVIGRHADTLPATLTDREFWALTQQLSEPNGYFVSRSGSPDNLLSNELQISTVVSALAGQVPPSGVYLGVGPEQNFTYIAAIKPRIAFITDIRRGNLDLHLVYKALFEMSANRGELVARLFSRKPTQALPRTFSAAQLMTAYASGTPVDEATYVGNLKAIIDLLTNKHGFALTADDRANIEHAYRAFYRFGPAIDYTSSINDRTGRFANYAALMASVDSGSGEERGFLATDENFALVKTMESRNLIVPVVGDFAGPTALRSIGAWLKARGATVSAFYVSNVEQYLRQKGVWPAFCANVATLPLDRSSIFIRPNRGGSSFSPMMSETAACAGK
ncbi:MAG TPA: hypothetical protein VFZ98_01965 [Vicinamibacterales bacterium]